MICLAEVVFKGRLWPAKTGQAEKVSAKLKFVHWPKDQTHDDEKDEFNVKANPGTAMAETLMKLNRGQICVVEKHVLNIEGEKTPPYYYKLFTKRDMGEGVPEYIAKAGAVGSDAPVSKTDRFKASADEVAEVIKHLKEEHFADGFDDAAIQATAATAIIRVDNDKDRRR